MVQQNGFVTNESVHYCHIIFIIIILNPHLFHANSFEISACDFSGSLEASLILFVVEKYI